MKKTIKKDCEGDVVIYIGSREEYEDVMDIAEYENILWNGGQPVRCEDLYYSGGMYIRIQNYNDQMVYHIAVNEDDSRITVFARDLHNYAVQIRLERSRL